MKRHTVFVAGFALASILSVSPVIAAPPGGADHDSHHPRTAEAPSRTQAPAQPEVQAPAAGSATAASLPALQARMKAIREATDPARRMALMEEQIQALEAATRAQAAPGPMGGPMMGGRGPGPGPGGMMMDPDLMREHMELMQRHMEMMQRMMNMPMAPARPAQ
jgi:hypothetical protein